MKKSEKSYNRVILNFEQEKYYLLWYSDEKDGFVLEENNKKLMKFENMDSINKFIKENGLNLNEHIAESNYNKKELLKIDEIDCELILGFWNDISDLSNSLKLEFMGDDDTNKDINNIYSKLFHGNNLPAYTGDRKRQYVPQ